MRALKIAGAAVAAIVVVAGLVLVIGIPSDFLTSAIQARVERETGYRLTIAGATRIGVWPSLNVSLADVTLQDPSNRDSSDRLTIGTLQADVTLSSLWSGHPEVTELVIERPVLSVPLLRERIAAPNPAPKGVVSSSEIRERQRHDPSRHRHRWRRRVVQFARPRRQPHRRHQRHRDDLSRSHRQRERQRPRRRPAAQIRHQGGGAGAADRAPEHSARILLERARPVAEPADGQGRSPAQRRGRDDQWSIRRARRRRLQRLGLGRSLQQATCKTRPRFPAARYRDLRRLRPRPPPRPRGATPRSILPG